MMIRSVFLLAALVAFQASAQTRSTETAAIPLAEVDQGKQPTRLARFANILEMCALALPNGYTDEGLPTSLQIACRGYEEALALRIGQAYQQATDWHERLPPAVEANIRGE